MTKKNKLIILKNELNNIKIKRKNLPLEFYEQLEILKEIFIEAFSWLGINYTNINIVYKRKSKNEILLEIKLIDYDEIYITTILKKTPNIETKYKNTIDEFDLLFGIEYFTDSEKRLKYIKRCYSMNRWIANAFTQLEKTLSQNNLEKIKFTLTIPLNENKNQIHKKLF